MNASARAIIIIIICSLCTFAERLLPFALFGKRKVPDIVKYLGNILPMAVMTTLVIYCIRGTSFSSVRGFVPPLAASALTAIVHAAKRNSLLSIALGTACYMLLIRVI